MALGTNRRATEIHVVEAGVLAPWADAMHGLRCSDESQHSSTYHPWVFRFVVPDVQRKGKVMANRPKRPCGRPGCPNLVERGYCEAHRKDADRRPSRSARGYNSTWKRVRARFIRRNPLCAECQGLAEEVHHIVSIRERPDLRLVESNLQSLCKSCHSRVTGRGK